MTSTGFDVLANRRYLTRLLEWVNDHDGAAVPLAEVRAIRCARAQPLDAAEHGDYWTVGLIDLVQKLGLGRLVREGGGLALRLVEPMPSASAIDSASDREFHESARRGA